MNGLPRPGMLTSRSSTRSSWSASLPAARRKRIGSLADLERVEAALDRALRAALKLHIRFGHAVPEWRNGRVVWLQPAAVLAEVDAAGHAPDGTRWRAKRGKATRKRRAR